MRDGRIKKREDARDEREGRSVRRKVGGSELRTVWQRMEGEEVWRGVQRRRK